MKNQSHKNSVIATKKGSIIKDGVLKYDGQVWFAVFYRLITGVRGGFRGGGVGALHCLYFPHGKSNRKRS